MITNKDITVINESNGVYFGVFLKGVSCIGKTARTATEKGLVSADYFTIRIMENLVSEHGFLRTESNEILETEDGSYFELAEADSRFFLLPQKTHIAEGCVADSELEDIKAFLKTHKVYTVVSVGDNRYGTSAVRHWRIDCK